MQTAAVIIESPFGIALRDLELAEPGASDVVVDVLHSGISTGTERLLWSGRMPPFPGLGYPLVPGYESVGIVTHAAPQSGRRVGETVFVPGARCFTEARCLFGATAGTLVAAGDRVIPVDPSLGAEAVLLALAATARHALAGGPLPDLIVGHGVLARLLARLAVADGGAPTVWETRPERRSGATGYQVLDPADDVRHDYRTICDVSGDSDLLDALVRRLAPGGEIVLAGFYAERLSFAFPPAFMKEARLRIAAQWQPDDLAAAARAVADGTLSLDGLLTHSAPATDAGTAYRTAFDDPACLKMVLDWS
ncbi:chlorophyll synthesis pathway protein BchC [Acuticoccus kandeliae]|uniref:chlorophyll synthesis pathway protein BchC n=1 Tax=Acuticoccus kandeliae TaxID=2073160 RepID=UPI000D3E6F26|nr:chlorophyll synthesis pathway protein BchC [Acuticoccus kandeliae]